MRFVQVLPGRFTKSLLSKKAEDHSFEPFADHTLRRKGTGVCAGACVCVLARAVVWCVCAEAPTAEKKEKKTKPNEPCPYPRAFAV